MKMFIGVLLSGLSLSLLACKSEETEAIASVPLETIRVEVREDGYHPAQVQAAAGQSVRLVFTRTSDSGCGQQLVIPSLGIHKDLPLKKSVAVNLTMPDSGQLDFTCGMDMLRGALLVR